MSIKNVSKRLTIKVSFKNLHWNDCGVTEKSIEKLDVSSTGEKFEKFTGQEEIRENLKVSSTGGGIISKFREPAARETSRKNAGEV